MIFLKLEILKRIEEYLKNKKEKAIKEAINEETEKRNIFFKYMFEDLSENFIENFNIQLIINSAGWLGGSCSQTDIRWYLLRETDVILTTEEYNFLFKLIEKNMLEENYKKGELNIDFYNKKLEELGDTSKEAFKNLKEPDIKKLSKKAYLFY